MILFLNIEEILVFLVIWFLKRLFVKFFVYVKVNFFFFNNLIVL